MGHKSASAEGAAAAWVLFLPITYAQCVCVCVCQGSSRGAGARRSRLDSNICVEAGQTRSTHTLDQRDLFPCQDPGLFLEMGCAQSSQSGADKRRNSREFYHQYHNNHNPRHQHAFVNAKPIKPVHQAKPTSPPRVPPTVRPQKPVVQQQDVEVAVVANGSAATKRHSPAEDMHFRRQHFDRNSVLRHSRKRSRKTSTTSVNSPSTTTTTTTPQKPTRSTSTVLPPPTTLSATQRKISEPCPPSQTTLVSLPDGQANRTKPLLSASENVAALLSLNSSSHSPHKNSPPRRGSPNENGLSEGADVPEIDEDGARLI